MKRLWYAVRPFARIAAFSAVWLPCALLWPTQTVLISLLAAGLTFLYLAVRIIADRYNEYRETL